MERMLVRLIYAPLGWAMGRETTQSDRAGAARLCIELENNPAVVRSLRREYSRVCGE